MDFSKYTLLYNAAAHFRAIEKYPDGLLDALTKKGFEGFQAICWALELLSTQGELARRDMGHDRQEPIAEGYALLHMRPVEALEAKGLIIQAVLKGIRIEGDGNEEVDEVLMEIQKKTGTK